MGRFKTLLAENRPLILHGALGTELEYQGHDVSGPLWSAKFLAKHPEWIQDIHETYLKCGADIVTTASYQATIPGLRQEGVTEKEAVALIKKTVHLAKAARDNVWATLSQEEKENRPYPLISGCIGPYAAYLADGSEYTGNYGKVSLDDLMAFHRPRLQAILEEEVDLLCLETIPNALEAEALVTLLSTEFPDTEAYMSFTAQKADSISDETALTSVIPLVEACPQILALGFNCSAPHLFDSLLKKTAELTTKPLVAYPNSGEIYNGKEQTWEAKPTTSHQLYEASKNWQALGCQIIGGCCRTRPDDIAYLAKNFKK